MPAQLSRTHRRLIGYAATLAAVVLFAVLFLPRMGGPRSLGPHVPITFDGSSDKLEKTVIVPTLDTPMPEGKNVIWCASFQLAWNEFRDDVIGEPVKIPEAQQIADRLNASTIAGGVLDAGDYYAKAGYVKDGAFDEIEEQMRKRFPDIEVPQFDVEDPDLVAVMYAYLAANVKFTLPFYEQQDALRFNSEPVTSFGIGPDNKNVPHDLLDQIEVLYYSGEPYEPYSASDEFIIDPCTSSKYQIILAHIKPGATLAETLENLQAKIAEGEASPLYESEEFLAPNMHWRVTHRFKALEDKNLGNEGHTGRWLEVLEQRIDFRLDRSGAELKSEARGEMKESKSGERRFLLNRPFLIVMRKRGGQAPFFVMWVDNAELLCKREEPQSAGGGHDGE